MRTTVTLDSDVEQALREVMAREGLSFKAALNQSIRRGLLPRPDYSYRTPAIEMGEPLVASHKFNLLAGMFDDEAILEKLANGR